MPAMKRHLPIALFTLLLATLLVGQRLGYPWAGGAGIPDLLGADGYRRGEVIRTGDAPYTEIRLGTVRLGLAERTDLELVSLERGDLRVRLIRGRIAVEAAPDVPGITVSTNATHTRLLDKGALSVVNYDFRNVVDITPIGTAVSVVLANGDGFVATTPQSVTEWPAIAVEDSAFDPAAGAAAAFYARFGLPGSR